MKVWKELNPPLVTSLVTTVCADGKSVNASPKSWWTPLSYDPAKLVLSTKPTSDTEANLRYNGAFVLHLPPKDMAEKILHTAKPLPYGENELDDQGIAWEWIDVPTMNRQLPVVTSIPWMACRVVAVDYASPGYSDHTSWTAAVEMSGGYPADMGIEDVLLHRSRNEFVNVGETFTVRPY